MCCYVILGKFSFLLISSCDKLKSNGVEILKSLVSNIWCFVTGKRCFNLNVLSFLYFGQLLFQFWYDSLIIRTVIIMWTTRVNQSKSNLYSKTWISSNMTIELKMCLKYQKLNFKFSFDCKTSFPNSFVAFHNYLIMFLSKYSSLSYRL